MNHITATDLELGDTATSRRCQQTQCAFFVRGGCQACDDCGAEPYVLAQTCPRCTACETVPDALRWGEAHHVVGLPLVNPPAPEQPEPERTVRPLCLIGGGEDLCEQPLREG